MSMPGSPDLCPDCGSGLNEVYDSRPTARGRRRRRRCLECGAKWSSVEVAWEAGVAFAQLTDTIADTVAKFEEGVRVLRSLIADDLGEPPPAPRRETTTYVPDDGLYLPSPDEIDAALRLADAMGPARIRRA